MSSVISHVIRQVVKEFKRHPFDINHRGNHNRCGAFCERVNEICPAAEEFDLNDFGYGHWCIKYNGKFYDAECPDGVKEWWELPFVVWSRRRR